jgi:hypothetical protein
MQSVQTIIEFILAGGASWLSSMIFDALRDEFPKDEQAEARFKASRLWRIVYTVLYHSFYARAMTLIMPWALVALAMSTQAYLHGESILMALDGVITAGIAVIVAQLKHAKQKSPALRGGLVPEKWVKQ